MKSCVVLAALLAACGNGDNGGHADARPAADAPFSCPVPTTPMAAGTHKLFVDFEGVTLTLGDCDDAKTNCSSLVSQASTMVPAFLVGQSNRAMHVTAIMAYLEQALAPFSIDAVTTRPSSGEYWMVTVGGTSSAITGTADQLIAYKSVCDATNTHSIALVFEGDSQTTDRYYADQIAGTLGHLAGLVPTGRSGDCMCTGSTCTHSATCTWGTNVVAQSGNTCSRTNQNEQQLLEDALGCR